MFNWCRLFRQDHQDRLQLSFRINDSLVGTPLIHIEAVECRVIGERWCFVYVCDIDGDLISSILVSDIGIIFPIGDSDLYHILRPVCSSKSSPPALVLNCPVPDYQW